MYITHTMVLEALERVVARHGEGKVYERPEADEGCLYVHEDAASGELIPGCIIGTMFHEEFNLPLEDLREWDGVGSVGDILHYPGINWSREATMVMEAAQWAQDNESTWGRALVRARDAIAPEAQ